MKYFDVVENADYLLVSSSFLWSVFDGENVSVILGPGLELGKCSNSLTMEVFYGL